MTKPLLSQELTRLAAALEAAISEDARDLRPFVRMIEAASTDAAELEEALPAASAPEPETMAAAKRWMRGSKLGPAPSRGRVFVTGDGWAAIIVHQPDSIIGRNALAANHAAACVETPDGEVVLLGRSSSRTRLSTSAYSFISVDGACIPCSGAFTDAAPVTLGRPR